MDQTTLILIYSIIAVIVALVLYAIIFFGEDSEMDDAVSDNEAYLGCTIVAALWIFAVALIVIIIAYVLITSLFQMIRRKFKKDST